MTGRLVKTKRLHVERPAAASPQAVLDRRELCFVAVERTRMPMIITDPRLPNNPIVLANDAFLKLTGYAAEDVIGRDCRFLQGPETSPIAVDEIRRAVADQTGCDVELLNYRKDGTTFWNALHLSPIHDDKGKLVYFFGSQHDVTEQRRAVRLEAVEHRLLREVDHRALNALAIVEGIVRLTKADDPKAYAKTVQRRVQALAKAHQLLAESGWEGVPLSQLLEVQVDRIARKRVHLEGPHSTVKPAHVQPLSLVFHELMVNAAMHGALSQRSGTLEVHWALAEDGHTVQLDWHEAGGPPPPIDRAPGFGTTVINGTLRRQLGGDLKRSWEPDGLKLKLSLPVRAPSDAPGVRLN